MPTKTQNINFDTSALVAGFQASVRAVAATEAGLGADAASQLDQLSIDLLPLVVAETQAFLQSTEPATQQEYLNGLKAIVVDKVADLAGEAIQVHKELVAQEVQRWVVILATVLKAALPVAAAL